MDIFEKIEAAAENDREDLAKSFLDGYKGGDKDLVEEALAEFMASLEVHDFTAQ